MKPKILSLMFSAALCFVAQSAQSQSTMEFQSGTTIEVTTGADICADVVTINGTYSGTGTQCGGALPVELVAMTAQAARSAVTLTWTTATETNNYGFEIERAAVSGQQTAVSWKNLGFVAGSGTSSSPREYSYTDKSLTSGRYAYRIKQIDNDGIFSYTQATEVEVGLAPREFTLSQNYPNPFNPSTTIEFTVPEDGRATLRVYDMLGREVATLFDGEAKAGYFQQAVFDAKQVASGAYFSRLDFNGKFLLKKMLLMK